MYGVLQSTPVFYIYIVNVAIICAESLANIMPLNSNIGWIFRFMVGCGRCDDWFHGDCVGLDLAKVQQMEKEDQEYVCLKCCAEEDGKGDGQATDPSDSKSPKKPGTEQSVTTGGIRPFRKVRKQSVLEHVDDHFMIIKYCEKENREKNNDNHIW